MVSGKAKGILNVTKSYLLDMFYFKETVNQLGFFTKSFEDMVTPF